MSNVPESSVWIDGIYQLEPSDPVLGGPGGIANRQAEQLASRTLFLKEGIEQAGADLAAHEDAVNPHPQYATIVHVANAIASLVASSPAALDTLNELATALGDDPNFATTITNALALKAPLASPALTGTPTAPTAGAGTNTTQIATTAFVAAAVADAGGAPLGNVIGAALAAVGSAGVAATAARSDHAHPRPTPAEIGAAPLASPAFTGTPTAPTAGAGTSTTQIATTAFVQMAVAALVASSPAALDTLNELAAALGNDPNFATTITNALAQKVALNGVLGTPSSGTLTNCTVDGTNLVGYRGIPQNSPGAAYTCTLGDAGKHVYQSGNGTVTIPANASVAFAIGDAITIVSGASQISIAINTDTMRLAGTGTTGTRTLSAYGMATAVKVAATEWRISGAGLS